jgi:hypothetical protein
MPRDINHGSAVAAHMIGNQIGICPMCTLVVARPRNPSRPVLNWFKYPYEEVIMHLLKVLDDVRQKRRQGRASLNMSHGYPSRFDLPAQFLETYRE